MASHRIDGRSAHTAFTSHDATAPETSPTSNCAATRATTTPTGGATTVEAFTPGPGVHEAPTAGPTSSRGRFELEQALKKQELLEGALRELTPILETAARLGGRVDSSTFFTDHPQSRLKQALRELPAHEVHLAVREGVQRAFPKASAAEVKDLVSDTMRQLRGVTSDAMARDLKGFIADTITAGARNFRAAARDPVKLETLLDGLSHQHGTAREEALQALGLPVDLRRPTAQQLADALTARANVMQRSATTLAHTDGKDTVLFRLASYPGMAERFAQRQRLDPESVGARALQQAVQDAAAEKSLRATGDVVLAMTSTLAFGTVAAVAALGTAGSAAVVAPVALADTARKLGQEDNAVFAARAGVSAGVMSADALTAAERHRAIVLAAQALELAGPVAGHVVGHALGAHAVIQKVAVEAGVTSTILGAKSIAIGALAPADGEPRGVDATSR
jgi:hypothetical protein